MKNMVIFGRGQGSFKLEYIYCLGQCFDQSNQGNLAFAQLNPTYGLGYSVYIQLGIDVPCFILVLKDVLLVNNPIPRD